MSCKRVFHIPWHQGLTLEELYFLDNVIDGMPVLVSVLGSWRLIAQLMHMPG